MPDTIMDKNRKLRITVVGIYITLFFVIIAGKAFYIQVIDGAYIAEKASYQYIKTRKEIQKRGNIYDKNNVTIASTLDGCSIGAHPNRIGNAEYVAETISNIILMDKISIENAILTGQLNKRPFTWIKRQLPAIYREKIYSYVLPGVVSIKEDYRFYPYGNTGTSVLGFVGIDPVGLDGIEYAYNSYLLGREQSSRYLIDALGRVFGFMEEDNSNSLKNDLQLTIDISLTSFHPAT
jgi:cell division protein FtsI (penicillin-binding protein 3)